MSLLPYAPAFRDLEAREQDALLERLYGAHDLVDLAAEDRDFLRSAIMQIANGAAESELPGSTGDFGRIDDAVDSGDDELIERVLDTVGRAGYPLSADEAQTVAAESQQYAELRERRPRGTAANFKPGGGAIWPYQPRWRADLANEEPLGTGPFTLLLVLRVHPDGTLDVCRTVDVPYSPNYERRETGALASPRAFIASHTPTQVWMRVDPSRDNIFPHGDTDDVYPASELRRLLERLHLA
ncbi:hypothetical protein AB0N29_01755 [Nocardioides sp. NPDC092400]|uniref:hypothetical protein n=1 Tax=Nocardioides sp. NPDC092400 TaxID=3155196 RepID=UPI00341D0934